MEIRVTEVHRFLHLYAMLVALRVRDATNYHVAVVHTVHLDVKILGFNKSITLYKLYFPMLSSSIL